MLGDRSRIDSELFGGTLHHFSYTLALKLKIILGKLLWFDVPRPVTFEQSLIEDMVELLQECAWALLFVGLQAVERLVGSLWRHSFVVLSRLQAISVSKTHGIGQGKFVQIRPIH